jgi:predicted phosphodiesterase
MRLHIFSDLHLEFAPLQPEQPKADVIIAAGDVDRGLNGLNWLKANFPEQPVIYILGNHEFYRHSLPALTHDLHRATAGTNIHLLEDAAVEIDGYTFVGCTLWTSFLVGPDPEAAMRAAEAGMTDFRIIRNSTEQRVLRARDTARLHQASVLWLKHELTQHDPARTVVVTHHAPSRKSEAPNHENSPLNPAFTSDLDAMIEASGVPLWIHGHTHYNVDYRIGSTRVMSNQRGYPNQACKGFDARLVVEI